MTADQQTALTADSSLDFPDLPSWPDVPTANLLRLNLQKLISQDPTEINRLWDACQHVGFFYLDLRDANGNVADIAREALPEGSENPTHIDGNTFLNIASDLFGLAQDFFDLPVEEKQKYPIKKDQGGSFGYKGLGEGIIDAKRTRDRNEFYNMSKDEMMGLGEKGDAPALIDDARPLIRNYIHTSWLIQNIVLNCINKRLELPEGRLQSLHQNLTKVGGGQVRFIRSPPQPIDDRQAALGAHADSGSVTVLFNRMGGLQILPPETDGLPNEEKKDKWVYARPLKGHCIVNLGDAMVKLTRGLLRSNIHRVVNPPGEEQGKLVRYSVVYFSKPTNDASAKPLDESALIRERKKEGEPEEEDLTMHEWALKLQQRAVLGEAAMKKGAITTGKNGA